MILESTTKGEIFENYFNTLILYVLIVLLCSLYAFEPQEEIASEQIVLSNGVANSETVTSCYTTSKFKKRSLSDTPGSEKKRRGRPPKPESEKKQVK